MYALQLPAAWLQSQVAAEPAAAPPLEPLPDFQKMSERADVKSCTPPDENVKFGRDLIFSGRVHIQYLQSDELRDH